MKINSESCSSNKMDENLMKNEQDAGAKPIRVLHVLASLDRGGAETMIMNFYRAMDRSKVQFDFIVNQSDSVYAYEEEIRALGGYVYQVPRYKISNFIAYRKAWKQLLQTHPEWGIIHGHHTAPASVYIPIAKRLGRLTIAHSHNSFVEENRVKLLVRKSVLRPLRHQADYLFACSKLAGEWMFGSAANFRVIKNAINTSEFIFSATDREQIRSELGIGKSFLIGHVGRFFLQKNHQFLLHVFRKVCDQHEDCRLLLVGEGELKSEIEDLAEKLGIRDRVIFAGVRSDIPALLSAMDLFLFPSMHEGFPVTLVEAQANGVPIKASDAISDEVAITDLIEFISLDQDAGYWAEEVLTSRSKRGDEGSSGAIEAAGYDVKSNAKELWEFYLNAVNSELPV